MSEQETTQPFEPHPVTRGSLTRIPATKNIAQTAAYIGIAKSTLYLAHTPPRVRTARSEGGQCRRA